MKKNSLIDLNQDFDSMDKAISESLGLSESLGVTVEHAKVYHMLWYVVLTLKVKYKASRMLLSKKFHMDIALI